MFDCSIELLKELIGNLPIYIGLYIIFDFTGSLLFRK